MDDKEKSAVAAEKLASLHELLRARGLRDYDKVSSRLNIWEKNLYNAARQCYAKASSANYVYDQRHIDFSTLVSFALCDDDVEREVLVPVVIYHDAGRYKAPVGVTKFDYASFCQRVLHMFEGMQLVKRQMAEQGYSSDRVELAGNIVGVHDWHYFRHMDPAAELEKYNPLVQVDSLELFLADIYESLLGIAESGVLDTPEFRAFHDADLLNIPAVSSFSKDFLGRGGKYFNTFSPAEFCLLRFGYFDLLDEAPKPDGLSRERLEFIRSKAKVEKVSTPTADSAIRRMLVERMADVMTGYLELETPLSESHFRQHVDQALDRELDYAMNLSQQ